MLIIVAECKHRYNVFVWKREIKYKTNKFAQELGIQSKTDRYNSLMEAVANGWNRES